MNQRLQRFLERYLLAIGVTAIIVAALIVGSMLAGCSAATGDELAGMVRTIDNPIDQTAMDGSPVICQQYRDRVISAAQREFGLNAPAAMLGAQMRQESGCNASARSPVGAGGLTQFMPSTATWIVQQYPDLGPAAPYDPSWAIAAQAKYMRLLYDHARPSAADECNAHAFALAGYNGGEAWRTRDQTKAGAQGLDPSRYWGNVERVNAGRTEAAWTENRGYAPRIIGTLQPQFSAWGPVVCRELLA